jgi:putative transposase
MARLPRLEFAGLPHLLVQRVTPGSRLAQDAQDRAALWAALLEASRAHQVAVHAYVLLDDHFHLLVTPSHAGDLGRFIQAVGRRYVAAYNRRHGRQGSLWAGRFRAAVIDPACYLLQAMVFIEGHAARAGLVPEATQDAADSPSSLAHHLGRRTDPLVTDHAAFWSLGNTPFDREAAWRARLSEGLSASLVATLARVSHTGWVLGDEAFQARLRKTGSGGAVVGTVRRLAPARRGRPPRSPKAPSDPPVL